MSASELEGGNVRYGNSYPLSNPGWHQGIVYEPQRFAPSNITRHFLNQHPLEESIDRMAIKDRSYLTGSSDQNSDSQEDQEIDLELRLSL
ncbi:unnamed protein product [Cuscuta campestris]|nr:unnamed protein product [Cuscuta campestris]